MIMHANMRGFTASLASTEGIIMRVSHECPTVRSGIILFPQVGPSNGRQICRPHTSVLGSFSG